MAEISEEDLKLDNEIMGGNRLIVLRAAHPEGHSPQTESILLGAAAEAKGIQPGTLTRSAFSATTAMQPYFEEQSAEDGTRSKTEGTPDAAMDVAKARPMAISLIEPAKPKDDLEEKATIAAVDDAKANGIAWGIRAVGAENMVAKGAGVKVAVLDTGILRDHPAFNDPDLNIIERDFTGGPDVNKAPDTNGHGTHCAGTIFGRDVEGVRIGVATGVTDVLIGKVIGGTAGTRELLEAMEWAISNGANVISMSLGFDHFRYYNWLRHNGVDEYPAVTQTLHVHRDNVRLFDATMNKFASMTVGLRQHTIVVAASGNESNRPAWSVAKSSPAAAMDVLSVGAVGVDPANAGKFEVAYFSNTNPDLVAPGVNVVSAGLDGSLKALSGTSMACPHIAGLAAIHWQSHLNDSLPQVTRQMVLAPLNVTAKMFRNQDFRSPSQKDTGLGMPRAG